MSVWRAVLAKLSPPTPIRPIPVRQGELGECRACRRPTLYWTERRQPCCPECAFGGRVPP